MATTNLILKGYLKMLYILMYIWDISDLYVHVAFVSSHALYELAFDYAVQCGILHHKHNDREEYSSW